MAILARYLSTLSLEIPFDYELFLHDDEPPIQVRHHNSFNSSLVHHRLSNSPRPEQLNQLIRLAIAKHTNLMSRVNCIGPRYRSPALMRQVYLLESQHEEFLRSIHDVEVLRRSDHTRVHRHHQGTRHPVS